MIPSTLTRTDSWAAPLAYLLSESYKHPVQMVGHPFREDSALKTFLFTETSTWINLLSYAYVSGDSIQPQVSLRLPCYERLHPTVLHRGMR